MRGIGGRAKGRVRGRHPTILQAVQSPLPGPLEAPETLPFDATMQDSNLVFVMRREATDQQVSDLVDELASHDILPSVTSQGDRQLVAVRHCPPDLLAATSVASGVDRAITGEGPVRFVDRRLQPEDTVVKVGGVPIGDGTFTVIAGPCAVESREQLLEVALSVKDAGAGILRGDAFKPRTSPYAFQGLGLQALEYLAEARTTTGLPFVVEVVDPRDVEQVSDVADMLRIGTRNMSNYALLKEVGGQSKPVLLKRGRTATIDEWANAAEYIYDRGNGDIVLVERGIRTFERSTRNTLDISAVPILKAMTHLPVMVDPSHASGRRDLVAPLAKAAIAVGADGVMVDVHPHPETALVDGDQALLPAEFGQLMKELRVLSDALDIDG